MEEQFYTYILYSTTKGRYYIGQTNNIEKRLLRHNNKEVRSTKHGLPWTLVYHEIFQTRSEAIKRERYLKSLKSRIVIKKLIDAKD